MDRTVEDMLGLMMVVGTSCFLFSGGVAVFVTAIFTIKVKSRYGNLMGYGKVKREKRKRG